MTYPDGWTVCAAAPGEPSKINCTTIASKVSRRVFRGPKYIEL